MNYIVTIPYRGVIPHLLKRGPIGTPIEIGEDMYEKLKASGVPMNVVGQNEPQELHHIPETPIAPVVEPETPVETIDEPIVIPTNDIVEEQENEDEPVVEGPGLTPEEIAANNAAEDPMSASDVPSEEIDEEDDGEDDDTTPEQKTSWTEEELKAMPKSRRRKCRKIMAENASKDDTITVE